MTSEDTVFNYRHVIAMSLVCFVVVVAFFPVVPLEYTVQSLANHWSPDKIHVEEFAFSGLLQSDLNLTFTIKDYVYSVPLTVRVTPGWSTFTLVARSQFEGFRARLNLYDRSLRGGFNDFPLDRFFYGVTGSANGSFALNQRKSNLTGEFLLEASTTEPIAPSPLIPPMVYGQTIETFHCKGTIRNNRISSDDFRLRTDQAFLEAEGSMDVREPLGASFMDATLNLKWPMKETIRLNDTLEGIGLI